MVVQPGSVVSDLRNSLERLMLPVVAVTDPEALNKIFSSVQTIVDHLEAENQRVIAANKAAEDARVANAVAVPPGGVDAGAGGQRGPDEEMPDAFLEGLDDDTMGIVHAAATQEASTPEER